MQIAIYPMIVLLTFLQSKMQQNEHIEHLMDDNFLDYTGFHTGFSVCGGRIFSEIFPEYYNLTKILLALPVGTASVERLFSHIKMIKHLMRIAIEGPDLSEVNFNKILDIFKENNRRIRL